MHEESRDMWRVYLDQQDYKSAFRHCKTQVQHTAQQPFVFIQNGCTHHTFKCYIHSLNHGVLSFHHSSILTLTLDCKPVPEGLLHDDVGVGVGAMQALPPTDIN